MDAVEAAPDTRYCINHPQVETVVSCGRCDRPICPRCMIFTPVGVRCRDCAQLRRLPQYTLTPSIYARVIPGMLGLALGLGFLLSYVPALGFFGGIIVGLVVSEALRRLSGYKQGREMEIIAGSAVVLAIVAARVFSLIRLVGLAQLGHAIGAITQASQTPLGLNGADLLGAIIGIIIAIQRLR